jgi:disulfide oxidoreductase YuzD
MSEPTPLRFKTFTEVPHVRRFYGLALGHRRQASTSCCVYPKGPQHENWLKIRYGRRFSETVFKIRFKGLLHDVDVRSDLHFFIQLDDVRIVHAKTAVRDGASDRAGPIGPVNPV